MKERVKELRKALNLTMEKFGTSLGVGKTAISKIESGERGVTDQMINSICKTNWNGRYVNEEWLRTGEGDMFKKMDIEEEIASFIGGLQKNTSYSFKKRLISVLVNLTEEQWVVLEQKLRELLDEDEE